MTNDDLSNNIISFNHNIDNDEIKLINEIVDEVIQTINELAKTKEPEIDKIEKFFKTRRNLDSIYKNLQL